MCHLYFRHHNKKIKLRANLKYGLHDGGSWDFTTMFTIYHRNTTDFNDQQLVLRMKAQRVCRCSSATSALWRREPIKGARPRSCQPPPPPPRESFTRQVERRDTYGSQRRSWEAEPITPAIRSQEICAAHLGVVPSVPPPVSQSVSPASRRLRKRRRSTVATWLTGGKALVNQKLAASRRPEWLPLR